jgi:hypothetical protein
MPSTAQSTAGTTIAISATLPTTYDADAVTGFPAATYSTCGEVTDIGEYGKEYNLITHNPIGDRKTYKFKGNYNNGTLALQMAADATDAGQAILLAASDSDASYAVKITHQDGAVDYFSGKVMTYKKAVAAESILSATASFEIDSDIVEVAAP